MFSDEEAMQQPVLLYLKRRLEENGNRDIMIEETGQSGFSQCPELAATFSEQAREMIDLFNTKPDLAGSYITPKGELKRFTVELKKNDMKFESLYQAKHDAETLDVDWAMLVDIVDFSERNKRKLRNNNWEVHRYFKMKDFTNHFAGFVGLILTMVLYCLPLMSLYLWAIFREFDLVSIAIGLIPAFQIHTICRLIRSNYLKKITHHLGKVRRSGIISVLVIKNNVDADGKASPSSGFEIYPESPF
jgi:hypothetical protein